MAFVGVDDLKAAPYKGHVTLYTLIGKGLQKSLFAGFFRLHGESVQGHMAFVCLLYTYRCV